MKVSENIKETAHLGTQLMTYAERLVRSVLNGYIFGGVIIRFSIRSEIFMTFLGNILVVSLCLTYVEQYGDCSKRWSLLHQVPLYFLRFKGMGSPYSKTEAIKVSDNTNYDCICIPFLYYLRHRLSISVHCSYPNPFFVTFFYKEFLPQIHYCLNLEF